MRKKFKLLTVGLLVLSLNVNAKNIEENILVNENAINKYSFTYKYTSLDESVDKSYDWFLKNNYDGADYSKERIKHTFLEYMVKEDIYNILDFENVPGLDMFCKFKGESYYDSVNNKDVIADKDRCEVSIYYGKSLEDMMIKSYVIYPNFEKVDGDSNITSEVKKLETEFLGIYNVADLDMVNHLINYESDTSTFFSNKSAFKEFSKLKNIIEKNTEYDFSISFEETRRGIGFSGIADGITYIKKDGIYYGYVYNGFFQSNMFYVPIDTKESDYASVLEKRIKDYINNDDILVKVEPLEDGATGVDEVLSLAMNMDLKKYYTLVGTNFEKEYALLDKYQSNKNLVNSYRNYENLVTAVPYKITIGEKTYEVGVIKMPSEYLNESGVISSLDTKTGIILKTKASNVPLDVNLMTSKYNLTDEEINLLKSKGYKNVDSYSLKLYSSILDKIISNFNDVTNVLIPYDGDAKDLVVLYIKDDGTFEKYAVETVTIEGIKYLSFNTNHFSNYIIASNNVVNPNTIDNVGLYFGMMALSLGVIVILAIKSKKIIKR